jgi:hypothetical protein
MKIDEEILGQIKVARNEARLLEAKAREAQAKLQLLVSEAILTSGEQIEDTALCLKCGTLRPLAEPNCPEKCK